MKSDTRLAGRYLLEEEIANGGMGEVWRATDEVLDRGVAVKILHRHLAADPVFGERFRREAVAAAVLAHPHIVSVFDTGEHEGRPFMVMELLPGGTLAERLRTGPLHPSRVAAIGAEVCDALAHAHDARIVHRDIKPANIFFSETAHLKVGDFGIAKAAFADGDLTTTGSLIGTMRYVAPEVVEGDEPDGRADLYSLGVILYEAVTGRPPFEAEGELATAMARLSGTPRRPRDLRPDVPRELDVVIMRALSRFPEGRFRDAREMARHLRPISEASAPPPPPPATVVRVPVDQTSFVKSEGRWLLPTLLVVLLAVGIVIAVLRLTGTVNLPIIGGRNPPQEKSDQRSEIRGAGSYDPEGEDGSERNDLVRLAHDGNPDTSWYTQSYTRADFGGLKQGVGLWIDMGTAVQLRRLEATSKAGGYSAAIRYSEDGRTWSPPGPPATVEREQVFAIEGTHRFYMIWITSLVQTPGRGSPSTPFSVGIAEVKAVR